MKLSFFICLVTFLQVSATSHAQKISLNKTGAPLLEIIKDIRNQSGYNIIYDEDLSLSKNKINIHVVNVSLYEALKQCFKDQPFSFVINNKAILITPATIQSVQVKPISQISGKVFDNAGTPLPGVNVKIKGTSAGTITGIDGSYSLNAPDNSILVFSYIGFESQEVTVNGSKTFNIILKAQANGLNEVVVIGYGDQRKNLLSTAIGTLSADQIKDVPAANPAISLAGQLAGVSIQQPNGDPGAAPVIRVRGSGSLSAGNDPLFVVDGYPLNDADAFNQINPSDIQSIEVLKDAAAAAIYGSRGGNGIIIVTTKRGKAGKTEFNINNYTGFNEVAKEVAMLNSQQFVDFAKDAYTNAGRAIPAIYLNANTANTNTNWQDQIFRRAMMTNSQISATGGSDAVKYLISGGYLSQEGTLIGSDYNRYTLRVNLDAQLTRKMKVGINLAPSYTVADQQSLNGSFTSSSGIPASVTSALVMAPIVPARLANGDYGQANNSASGSGLVTDVLNPVAPLLYYTDRTTGSRAIGNFYFQYDIIKGLQFKTTFGASYLGTVRNIYIPSTIATGLAPTASFSKPVPAGIQSSQTNAQSGNWVWENTLTYNKTFHRDHNLTLLGGFSSQENSYQNSMIFGQSLSFLNDLVPNIGGSSYLQASNISRVSTTLESFFGRANYSFKDKYLFSASLRSDGSSRFGPNRRYATFPAFSAAWRLTQEPFMQKFPVISQLKIRGSYGVTGNYNIGDYIFQSYVNNKNYGFGQGSGTITYGYNPTSIANNNLTWETNKQTDIGLELGLFQDRLNFTADAYIRNTTGLLNTTNVPAIVGFTTTYTENIGNIQNKGLEFAVNSVNVSKSAFSWKTNANISFNRNKVISLVNNNFIGFAAVSGWNNSIEVLPGQPLGSFYGYKQIGVFLNQADLNSYPHIQGAQPGDIKLKDANGDGKIDAKDIVKIGNALPKFTYGFTNNFTYRNFDLNIVMQGVYGNNIVNGIDRYNNITYTAQYNARVDALNRWRSPSDPGDGWTPRAATNAVSGQFSSRDVYDASFLRVRTVALGYSMPAILAQKLRVRNIRLYTSVENLFTFSPYFGYSPEANIGNNSTILGVDQGTNPLPRTFILGLNVNL